MCLFSEYFIIIFFFRFWLSFLMKDKWLILKNFNCKSKDLICIFYFINMFFLLILLRMILNVLLV